MIELWKATFSPQAEMELPDVAILLPNLKTIPPPTTLSLKGLPEATSLSVFNTIENLVITDLTDR